MIEKTRFFVERAEFGQRIDIRFCVDHPDGNVSVANSVNYSTHDPTDWSQVGRPAPIGLRMTDAQQLMDELWRAGLRPSEGTGSAGSLAATERHLADMKTIAFHALKIGKP